MQSHYETNWIPEAFQVAAERLARDAIRRFIQEDRKQVIGLGSGPMAASIVRALGNISGKERLECVPTSFQIKLEARCSGLRIADESRMPDIDVVFDGADEVDARFDMIKGGGGALLKEKIVHTSAKKVVIAAESSKFVPTFTWPVPIEIHPFGIHSVKKKLEDSGGRPRMRMLKEGYPYVTENGNFILDTSFDFSASEVNRKEIELKSLAGVAEVGLFTRHADVYYKAKDDGSFEVIEL